MHYRTGVTLLPSPLIAGDDYGPFAPDLVIQRLGTVRLVTLNRPKALNAANGSLHDALADVWDCLEGDLSARAVVLTGAGRAFSAGGDLDHLQELARDKALRRHNMEQAEKLVRRMTSFPLPVVAAVNGPAVGLGASVALLCDIVIMAESAYLADPHVSVGLTAADGGVVAWPLLTSLHRAKEYLYTGDRIPSDVAVAIGLANRVVSDTGLMTAALELAQRLAAQPTQALRATKVALNLHLAQAVSEILPYALAREFESFDEPEHRTIVERLIRRNVGRRK